MKTAKVQALLQQAQDALLHAIQGISEDDADTVPVEGNWTARDFIANLAAYENVLEDIFGNRLVVASGGPFLFQVRTMSEEEFNRFHYEENRNLKYSEILAKLQSRFQHVLTPFLMKQMTDDLLNEKGVLPWYGERLTVGDYIANSHVPRKLAVAQKLEKFKAELAVRKEKPSKKPDKHQSGKL
jgi:hypothetical protein